MRGSLQSLASIEDVRLAARARLPRMVFDFIEGGAEDEVTVAANRSGFSDLHLRPRVLTGTGTRDLATTVVGQRIAMPAIMSPAGLLRLAHADGEVAAARAAERAGTVFTLSTGSSCTIEEVAEASQGPRWFQLYLWRDREVVGGLIERARRAGYTALVLTVDVPVVGQRERDLRNGMTLPPRPTMRNVIDIVRRPHWVSGYLRGAPLTFANFTEIGLGDSASALGAFVNREMIDAGQSWADLEWLRTQWDGPLLIKGIVAPEDAHRAVDLGADGIIVSNHGGRQLDAMVGAVAALPDIVDAVGDRVDIILDGGIRRGTDIVKALALGARAVMIGRPYVYGLGAAGATGALRVMDILREELDRALTLVGCARAADLDGSYLVGSRARNPVEGH